MKGGITCFLGKVSSIGFVGSDVRCRIFVLLPCFIVAEYVLSYQNTARNNRLMYMSLIIKPQLGKEVLKWQTKKFWSLQAKSKLTLRANRWRHHQMQLVLSVTRFVQHWIMLLQEQRQTAAVQLSHRIYKHSPHSTQSHQYGTTIGRSRCGRFGFSESACRRNIKPLRSGGERKARFRRGL